jgi:hypothetical protein
MFMIYWLSVITLLSGPSVVRHLPVLLSFS